MENNYIPKFLFVFDVNKDKLTRSSNNQKYSYDKTNSNLVFFNLVSLKMFVRVVSLLYIISQIVFLLYIIFTNNSESTKSNSKYNNEITITNTQQESGFFSNSSNIRNLFLIAFNLITFTILLSSSFSFDTESANIGLTLFELLFIVHLILFVVLCIYMFLGKLKEIFSYVENDYLVYIVFSFSIYLLVEFYFVWNTYIFTYNIIVGNDAYVNGEYFNKYVENLASSNVSRINSQINTPSRNSKKSNIYEQFSDDY